MAGRSNLLDNGASYLDKKNNMTQSNSSDNIQSILDSYQQMGLFPGGVVALVKPESPSEFWTTGQLSSEPESPTVTPDTVFDIASITKTLPTASLALKLWELNQLAWDEPVIEYVPTLQGEFAGLVTIRDLMEQTVYFPQSLARLKNVSASELHDFVSHSLVAGPPGDLYQYNNTASILLGWIIEKKTKRKLADLAQEYFFDPLAMNRTTFYPKKLFKPTELKNIIAPSEHDEWRGGDVQGEVHDESAWVLSEQFGPVGSAGLFSTANDLAKWLKMLLSSGLGEGLAEGIAESLTENEKPIFQPETIELIKQGRLLESGQLVGLGWEWHPTTWGGTSISDQTIGKTGFTGCSILIDWKMNIGLVILSNATYPQRPDDRSSVNIFRSQIISASLQLFQVR